MLRKISLVFCLLAGLRNFGQVPGQKPAIDSSAYTHWPEIRNYSISNDGNYVCYIVHQNAPKQDTLFVESTDGSWKQKLPHATITNQTPLTRDSRKILFQRSDTIFLADLGKSQVDHFLAMPGTGSLLNYGKYNNLLMYQPKNDSALSVLREIHDGKQWIFSGVERCWSHENTERFVLLVQETKAGNNTYHLKYIDSSTRNAIDFWEGTSVENLVFSESGTEVAFITNDSSGKKAIWYSLLSGYKPIKLLDDASSHIDPGLRIGYLHEIDEKNGNIYFTLTAVQTKHPSPAAGVDVWSYKDPKLQSLQLHELQSGSRNTYQTLLKMKDGSITRLEYENDDLLKSDNLKPGSSALLVHRGAGDAHNEWNWNKNATSEVYLLSLKDGRRKNLSGNLCFHCGNYFYLSPDESHLVFYDCVNAAFYSVEVKTGISTSLTGAIREIWTEPRLDDWPIAKTFPIGVAGFSEDSREVLLYSKYDIYKVDLSGKSQPINITGGYGLANRISFRVAGDQHRFTAHEKIILKGFNNDTKDEGFYSITLDHRKNPDSLSLLPKKMDILTKARDVNAYIVLQQDASSFPNIGFTRNFKSFRSVTDIHPEKDYNWLTTELVTWKLSNGRLSQGVLYKPENFDPHKKYPLIIQYYERKSDKLHTFIKPEPRGDEINLSLYVSNEFLVFTPDIHYTIGEPGRSAFNVVISAAAMLAKRNYVDAHRMGLQGHSFGGFETNYIIAHTDVFAAAMSASGMTDLVSIYGSIIGDGSSRQRQYELYRDRIGATLWEKPKSYLENSPVLRANHIKTPLLMMANKNDDDVPYQQGIELFTALRRLGKKAWLLQYDGSGHSAFGKSALDFSIRVFQFFDHYLKDAPPPKWMTDGVPAIQKGLFTGLETDLSGATP